MVLKGVKLIETESRRVGGMPEAGELMFNGDGVSGRWKCSRNGWWRWLQNDVNVLNATELYTKK